MRKQIYKILAVAGGLTLGAISAYSQTHDLDFKVYELTNGTGANVAGVQIELDDGKYLGITDANGVAHIHAVTDGTHRVKIAKEGYIQFLQDGYVLSSNQNFNASIIKKNQIGAWGDTDFIVSWWRQTFKNVGLTMRSKDPPRWDHIMPVYNRISATPAYTYADSVNIVTAINEIESNTGLNLINLIPNSVTPDTTYTLYTHSTNTSAIGVDVNNIIFAGYSKFSVTLPTKRVIHEIVQQFGMWPISSGAYVSVMEPDISLVADMQPWDANNLAITMYQHLAKRRGEQNLFLGNMMEYVTPVIPAATSITLPINNATDLENMVRFTYDAVAGTGKYHMDIATDETFTNIVHNLTVYRSDTTITLSDDQQYYARVQAINTAGSSAWSSTVAFHTQIPTSVEDINLSKEFRIYPNPASEYISIEFLNSSIPNIKIDFLTSEGRLVKSINSYKNNSINISDLIPGLYHIRVSYPNIDQSVKSKILTLIKE